MAYAQNFEVQTAAPSRREQRTQRRVQKLGEALTLDIQRSADIIGPEGMEQIFKIARTVLNFEAPQTDSIRVITAGDYEIPVRIPTQRDAEDQLLQNLTPLETRLYGRILHESGDRRMGKYGLLGLLSRLEAGLSPEDGSEASTTEQVSA